MLSISINKFSRILFWILMVLTFLNSFLSYVKSVHPTNDIVIVINNLFNFNMEANIPTIFSVLLLFFASFILYFIGRNEQKHKTIYWYLMSFLFVLAGIDEFIQVHERVSMIVSNNQYTNQIIPFGWVSLWLVFIIIILIIFFKFICSLPRKTRNQFLLAGLVYVIGALVFEVIGGYYSDNRLIYKFCYTIEEFMEMAGLIIFIYAFLDYLYKLNPETIIKLEK